jgi:hypothetical protein
MSSNGRVATSKRGAEMGRGFFLFLVTAQDRWSDGWGSAENQEDMLLGEVSRQSIEELTAKEPLFLSGESIAVKRGTQPGASFATSPVAQKCKKNSRGSCFSIWLCNAVTSMPLPARAFTTGATSSAVSTKSPAIAARPVPVD